MNCSVSFSCLFSLTDWVHSLLFVLAVKHQTLHRRWVAFSSRDNSYILRPTEDTPKTLQSACPADTVLPGLNYLKGQDPVLAMPGMLLLRLVFIHHIRISFSRVYCSLYLLLRSIANPFLIDEAYPEWLWKCLDPKVIPDDGPGGRKDRMERRARSKKNIKERNFMNTQK
jgi:large subunit ribosomal protein L54